MNVTLLLSIALYASALSPHDPFEFTEAKLIQAAKPDYTVCARLPKKPIVVNVTVGPDGSVVKAIALSAPTPCQALTAAAAVRNFRFTPGKLNGIAATTSFFITLEPPDQPALRVKPETI